MDAGVENNVKAVRRSKEEKKVLRKQIKTSHTLLKHEGISTTPQPSKVNSDSINVYRLKTGSVRDMYQILTCLYKVPLQLSEEVKSV